MGLGGFEKCIFVPSGGALGFPRRRTRDVLVGCCFGPLYACIGFCFLVPLYAFCVLEALVVWVSFICLRHFAFSLCT